MDHVLVAAEYFVNLSLDEQIAYVVEVDRLFARSPERCDAFVKAINALVASFPKMDDQ